MGWINGGHIAKDDRTGGWGRRSLKPADQALFGGAAPGRGVPDGRTHRA